MVDSYDFEIINIISCKYFACFINVFSFLLNQENDEMTRQGNGNGVLKKNTSINIKGRTYIRLLVYTKSHWCIL